ncbi:hypothetical protein [Thauera humireducens]|uniref:hypothetical protein n=1 Tax=Thauera humireducens TaxID=1134435 RepID=UPI00311FDC9A
MNEAQIVLHNHPLSRAREASGLVLLNSVWLWGAGEFARMPQAPAALVQATDPLSIGLARASQCPVATPDLASALRQDTLVVIDSLHKPAQRLDLDAWRRGLEALERDWFAPLPRHCDAVASIPCASPRRVIAARWSSPTAAATAGSSGASPTPSMHC